MQGVGRWGRSGLALARQCPAPPTTPPRAALEHPSLAELSSIGTPEAAPVLPNPAPESPSDWKSHIGAGLTEGLEFRRLTTR